MRRPSGRPGDPVQQGRVEHRDGVRRPLDLPGVRAVRRRERDQVARPELVLPTVGGVVGDGARADLAQTDLAERIGVVAHLEADLDPVDAERLRGRPGDPRPDVGRPAPDLHLGVGAIEELLRPGEVPALEQQRFHRAIVHAVRALHHLRVASDSSRTGGHTFDSNSRYLPCRTSNRCVWSLVPRTASAPGPLAQTGTTAPVCCWLGGTATGALPSPPKPAVP